jgi:hypothetical protein
MFNNFLAESLFLKMGKAISSEISVNFHQNTSLNLASTAGNVANTGNVILKL